MEHWKDVVGYEEYFSVSSFGRLFSKRTNKILSQTISKTGYYIAATKFGGRKGTNKCFKIHRLVCDAFLPPPTQEQLLWAEKTYYGLVPVNHKDGNKLNNNIENLEWTTGSENTKHAITLGLIEIPKGEDSTTAHLTNAQAEEIRILYKPFSKDFGIKQLAKKYNVSVSVIKRVVSGETYKV